MQLIPGENSVRIKSEDVVEKKYLQQTFGVFNSGDVVNCKVKCISNGDTTFDLFILPQKFDD